jgi:hypothetical protein
MRLELILQDSSSCLHASTHARTHPLTHLILPSLQISTPAASTTTSPVLPPYFNPSLITTLWPSLATTLPTAALLPPAKALPLLQMPRQQLVTGLQRLVQQGLDEQPPTGELTVALQLVAASWDEVLPLLGLAQRWGHFFTLQGMAERVIATRRIAAGGGGGLRAPGGVTMMSDCCGVMMMSDCCGHGPPDCWLLQLPCSHVGQLPIPAGMLHGDG